MRNAFIILAFVIAGIVFCCAFAYTVQNDFCQLLYIDNDISYNSLLSTIANVGVFSATLYAALYAVLEFDNHKKENRVKLLGEYNQRFSSDVNIRHVITWMLRVAIIDNQGEIIGADLNGCYNPGIYKKEMFMRFFEELYLHIEKGNIDKRQACLLFSYYAIKYDEIKEFRLDITDYCSGEELVNVGINKEKDNCDLYWTNYRKFVNEMREEWKEIKKQQIKEN